MPGWTIKPRTLLLVGASIAVMALGAWFTPRLPDQPEVVTRRAVGWTEAERLTGLARESDTETRKRRFVGLVLPLILAENDAILGQRRLVKAYVAAIVEGRAPSLAEHRLVARLASAYGVAGGDPFELLSRIDIVPPSLALAQAAVESGWGTSRFAQQGNALFGQRAWSEGAGLVPEARAENAGFEVRAFANLAQSVRSYMLNLNRHDAYAPFRLARAELRAIARTLDGEHLALTLVSYSEQGEEYVELVRAVLRGNGFGTYDGARAAIAARAPFDSPVARKAVVERSG